MYSATVLVRIKKFVVLTSGVFGQSDAITAKIGTPKDTSPPPHPKPPVFSRKKDTIYIKIPKGYTGSVQLTYQLPDPRYVMLGSAYKGTDGSVGRVEFRNVALERDLTGSELTVTDVASPRFNRVRFDYLILVQEVSSGNIGVIDPGVETEGGE
jgi:hypothetical protein